MRLLPIFSVAGIVLQSIWLALGQIWSNKVRSILTTLGIVIGVASVTAVIAVLNGLKEKVLSDFQSMGTNKMYVVPQAPDRKRFRNVDFRRIDFKPNYFDDMLKHCPSVKAFSRIVGSPNVGVQHGGLSDSDVRVSGVEPAWHEIENRNLLIGRPFSLIDMTQARHVCIINPTLRDKLRLNRDCTGVSLIAGDRRYQVIGVVEAAPQSGMFGMGKAASEMYVPFTTLYRQRPMGCMVIASAKSTEVTDDARAEILFYLRRVTHIKPDEPRTFEVHAMEKFVEKFKEMAMNITLVAAGLVGISLLVGGIGIMNIMLVSVSERTREIGLRKAVGAKPSAILLQFLIESMTLCFVGGMIGLALGHGLTKLVSELAGSHLDKSQIPFWAVLLAFGFAGSVGLVFGMFPAVKAARLDPIVALRHE